MSPVPTLGGATSLSPLDAGLALLAQEAERSLLPPEHFLELLTPGRVLALLLLVVATHLAVRLTGWLLERAGERFVRFRIRIKQAIPLARLGLWLLAAQVAVFGILSPEPATLLGVLAASAVAVGFAAQDLVRDILAGLALVLERPFQVGDRIRTEEGHYGEVVRLGLRTTRIRTANDDLLSLPNSSLAHRVVANANSGSLECQVQTELWISDRADLVRARRIAREAAVTSRFVLLERPVEVHAEPVYRNAPLIRLTVRAYVLDHRDELRFRTEVTQAAREGLAREGMLPPVLFRAEEAEATAGEHGRGPDRPGREP